MLRWHHFHVPIAPKWRRKSNFAEARGVAVQPMIASFIQALRAFRRAEIVFDVVLFESCVGEVAVAMTVASIFYFEVWFLWGVVFKCLFCCLLEPFVDPKAVPWSLLGVIWGSVG